MMKDCIIIGGGIGGLFTGAFLSKNGVRVTVLEKNSIIGGGLQCFQRDGKIYETGMHVIGGFEPGGTLYRICRYLGILDKLKIQHIPHDCMDELYYHKTNETFKIASGKDGFIDSLSKYFPAEKEGIKAYVEALFEITKEVPLFYLKGDSKIIDPHTDVFYVPADELIAKYVSDPKLQEILAYLNPLYGGVKGHTPAYVHALLNVLYIKGASRFIAGSQQLADALQEIICANGGAVYANKEVARIDVTNRHVNYIETTKGDKFRGDDYVFAAHPTELLKFVPKGTFRKIFVNRLNEIPNTCSAFSIYIDLKPNSFRYIDHTCYYVEEFGHIWNQFQYDAECWPYGFMYMTPPDENQGEYASRLLIHCIMDYAQVKQWEQTSVGQRGEAYEQWKAQRIDMIMSQLSNLFPDFRNQVERIYAASPLTIRDYYGTKNGAIFGYRKDCKNLIFSQLTVYTKVRNLFLTGQNINLHGICGVPLTAINTSEAILGEHVIINAINHDGKDI
jgi:all-trans-retinol 13,14-reductase